MSVQETLNKNKLKDLKILFALLALGDKSDREIARYTKLNNSTVSRRKKIEQEGFIKQYTAIPNFSKIGLEYIMFSFALSSNLLGAEQFEYAKKFALRHPEILCLLQDQSSVGTYWLAVHVHRNYESYLKLLEEIEKELINADPPPPPIVDRRTFMFHTSKNHPKMFNFRDLESILLQK